MIIIWLGMLLIVLLRPGIWAQENTELVNIGDTVFLKCLPTSERSDVPTRYQWSGPNGNVLAETNKNLVIPNFSYANEGRYTCRATQTIAGQVYSNEKSMNVKVRGQTGGGGTRGSFVVTAPQVYETFYTGIIYMSCKVAEASVSDYTYEWITPRGAIIALNNYFKDKPTREDAGRYTCRVTRKSDRAVVESYTNVVIQDVPIVIKAEGTQTLGSTMTLNCAVDKEKTLSKVYRAFQYRWLDPSNNVISTNNILDLPLTDATKFGFYTCEISSESYKTQQRVEVRPAERVVETTYTASFLASPSIAKIGEPFQLNCQVKPDMEASYSISFNNVVISNQPRFYIPRLGVENIGVYECLVSFGNRATGQYRTLKTTYTLSSEYKPESKIELSVPPGPRITVRVGDKRELHCEAPRELTGRSAEWFFEGIPLTQENFGRFNMNILRMLRVSILSLKNIQTNNQGRYECRIGGETKEVYVLVMARAKSIDVNPPVENSRTGDRRPIEFHCRADGYNTRNRDLIWTFKSSSTGEITSLDWSRWKRTEDSNADETTFIVLQQAELRDDGTYICTEPTTNDSGSAKLNVISEARVVITPPLMKLRMGSTATFQCYVINGGRSPDDPVFTLSGGRSARNDGRMTTERLGAGKVQLIYRSVTASDNGTEFQCQHGGSTVRSLLLVDPVCVAGSRLCRNGECISMAKFCDGRYDCADRSDEDPKYCKICDPLTKECGELNGKPPTTKFFQVHWSCDGEDDCGNGFDESKCQGSLLTCGGLNYRCMGMGKTIPRAFMCDRDRDCPNGDDEDRCVLPSLISEELPSYQRSVKRGETLRLTCRAIGNPLPKIIWRYNWGCLTDEARMTVVDIYQECLTTVSILTILNFQPGDDGIYNCEALSGGKRAWSKDYQVLMDFKN